MKKISLTIIALIVLGGGAWFVWRHENAAKTASSTQSKTNGITATISGFNKKQYSLTDPTSIWIIVNKQHPLNPKDYAPSDLVVPNVPLRVPGNESMEVRHVTATALQTMFAAAKSQGINLMLASGYRSYGYQVSLYNGYIQTQGQATADTQSARPGYSEHQTGLAADLEPASRICEVEQCFAGTAEGKWLVANAYKYGFIIRYSADKVAVTGYEYEPWHVRYVGTALSGEMRQEGIETLEEFFGVSGGPNYNT